MAACAERHPVRRGRVRVGRRRPRQGDRGRPRQAHRHPVPGHGRDRDRGLHVPGRAPRRGPLRRVHRLLRLRRERRRRSSTSRRSTTATTRSSWAARRASRRTRTTGSWPTSESAQIEAQLKGAGVPKVTGVWCPPEAGRTGLMTVIAVDQAYPGHATQALLVGGQVGRVRLHRPDRGRGRPGHRHHSLQRRDVGDHDPLRPRPRRDHHQARLERARSTRPSTRTSAASTPGS